MRLNRKCGNFVNVKLRTTCRAILQYSSSLLLLICRNREARRGCRQTGRRRGGGDDRQPSWNVDGSGYCKSGRGFRKWAWFENKERRGYMMSDMV